MNRQVRPPSSTSSSTGSTVVPATLSTTARSSPASLLSSEDLPTLGLPTIATRRGPPTPLEGLLRRLRQRGQDGVQHVAGAAAVQGGDRVRLAEAEVPQAVRLGLGARVVDLVGRQDDRLLGLAQDADDGLVGVGDADGRVDDEEHGVGEPDRDLGLGADPLGEAPGVGVPAAGVDDGERAAVPDRVVGDPVAGHAGHVLDDRLAAADDPVDQGGLADVGPADDGQHRSATPVRRSGDSFSDSGSVMGFLHGSGPRPPPPGRRPGRRPRRASTPCRRRARRPRPSRGARRRGRCRSRRGASSDSRVASTSAPPSSAARRRARAAASAVRKTLTSASGATTEPMSRPSTTMPPAPMISRWSSSSRRRTSGTAATGDTRGVRPRRSGSPAPRRRRRPGSSGRSGSVPERISGSSTRAATAAGSWTSTPWRSIHQVMARYIAPVSR